MKIIKKENVASSNIGTKQSEYQISDKVMKEMGEFWFLSMQQKTNKDDVSTSLFLTRIS
jgi:hypothetical protein